MSDPRELATLRTELTRLQAELTAVAARLAALEAPAAAAGEPLLEPGEALPASKEPLPPAELAEPAPVRHWESLVGGQWALWAGVAAIFLAIAFFLPYAWQALPALARVGAGYLVGLGFLAGGWRLREHSQSWFAEGLAGAGVAVLYLITWVGLDRMGVFAPIHGLLLVGAITLGGIWLALRMEAQSLAVLTAMGAAVAPLTLGEGPRQPAVLLTYLALLNSGTLALALVRLWPWLGWTSLGATVLLLTLALFSWVSAAPLWFVLIYLLQFVGVTTFRSLVRRELTSLHDVRLLCAASITCLGEAMAMVASSHAGPPWLIPLGGAGLFALLALLGHRRNPENHTLRLATIGLALTGLTVALLVALQGPWLAAALLGEATLLLTFDARYRQSAFRLAGLGLGLVAGGLVAQQAVGEVGAIQTAWPVLNAHELPLLLSVLAGAWLLYMQRRWQPEQLAKSRAALVVAIAGTWLLWLESLATRVDAAWALAVVLYAAWAWLLWSAGQRLPQLTLRYSALAVLALALATMVSEFTAPLLPFLNLRVAAVAALGGAMALIWRAAARLPEPLPPVEQRIVAFLPSLVLVLLVLVVSAETHGVFRVVGGAGWEVRAQLAISVVWTLGGAALLLAGLWRDSRVLRGLGLGWLAFAVAKVFLIDLASLAIPSRILATGLLGCVLIGVSWLYGRRAKAAPTP